MSLFLLSVCLMNVLGLVVLAYAVFTAPDGFEDQEGFHQGDRPVDPATQRQLARVLSRV